MASLQQRSHLDRLPNELKLLIIENTRKRVDWKDLSLVSRAWALLVLPLLWDTFNGDLTFEAGRNRRLLADPTSNIAKYVRHLDIQDRDFRGSNLPTCLFAAIPKGQLRSFRCLKGAWCIDNLHIMLRLHPGLTELSVAGGRAMADLLTSPWTTECFSNLVSLGTTISYSALCASLPNIWIRCPNLTNSRLIPPKYRYWPSHPHDFRSTQDDGKLVSGEE